MSFGPCLLFLSRAEVTVAGFSVRYFVSCKTAKSAAGGGVRGELVRYCRFHPVPRNQTRNRIFNVKAAAAGREAGAGSGRAPSSASAFVAGRAAPSQARPAALRAPEAGTGGGSRPPAFKRLEVIANNINIPARSLSILLRLSSRLAATESKHPAASTGVRGDGPLSGRETFLLMFDHE